MSSWSRFATILQTRPLDRETKLKLIDLVSAVDDRKLEEEIFSFVFAWDEAQAQTDRELLESVKHIVTQYESSRNRLEAKTRTTILSVADDVARQQKIETLRATIKTL